MPEFFHDSKLYYTPIEFALKHIGGPWKMPILWRCI
jgi:DNA-binding HxlR family transcriptional regulator